MIPTMNFITVSKALHSTDDTAAIVFFVSAVILKESF